MKQQTILSKLFVPIGVCAFALMSFGAHAAPCTFGPGSGETSLQSVLNQSLSTSMNATTDCLDSDTHWQVSNGTAETTLFLEIAGFAGKNRLGIYDASNPANTLEIFAGADGANANRTITATAMPGSYLFEISEMGSVIASTVFAANLFGFYLSTPQGPGQTYYSDTSLNVDGVDHMYAYPGNGSVFTDWNKVPESLRGTTFGSDMHLLAWEDLLQQGDGDYQDMILSITGLTPVPLPSALVLFGSGLLLFGAGARSRAKKSNRSDALVA